MLIVADGFGDNVESEGPRMLEVLAGDVIEAVKSGDRKMLAEALRACFNACEAEESEG